jgi:alanine racemase
VTVRATRAEVDAGAIAHNVSALARIVAPAELCVVVKADGYGHGAVGAARAALAAGATRLAVARTEEGAALRAAAIEAPVLLLSEPPPTDAHAVIRARLEPAVYTEAGITALAAAASADEPLPVHLKVDTGMHRVGCRPGDATRLAKEIVADGRLRLASVWTHLAVADEPDEPFTGAQLAAYHDVLRALESAGIDVPLRHAANSAGAIAHPDARFDMVRCGIAVYGIPPSPALADSVDLQPALRLVSAVSLVKVVEEGATVSYGRRYRATRPSVIATVPLGYADGVRRRLGAAGGEVLIRGRRRPIAGTVTMDQLMVDCGDDETVAVGDEVVLIGRQDDEEVPATEWAERLDTIGYEIVCGIGPRVPRHWTGDDR